VYFMRELPHLCADGRCDWCAAMVVLSCQVSAHV